RFHQSIGTTVVHARLEALTRYWIERARGIPGFRLHTPTASGQLGGVSLFFIDGRDARHIERELRDVHHVHVKFREVRHMRGLRVSPGIYTLESDLDRFVSALERVVAG